jgi:class 3 adenylate cyclase
MDFLARDRIGRRLLDGLSALGVVVLFDRRGIGLSDPITDWSVPLVEQWADDLAAVIADTCADPPVVLSLSDYWGPARLFAAAHPSALSKLVLYEPVGPIVSADLSRVADQVIPAGRASKRRRGTPQLGKDWIGEVCPSRAADQPFREWWDAAGRTGASPGVASRVYESPPESCVARLRSAHERITVPTLVLRRPANRLGSASLPDPVAEAISDARRVDLPGDDFHWLGEDVDSLLAEISRFVTGAPRLPQPERMLSAVLFTDLVGSTEQASAAGDRRWRTILDHHDAVIADIVAHNGGEVIKTTGDGVVATFPSADRALTAATAIRASLHEEDLHVRIGVHVGDIERRGDDVAGLAVHIAARVMALARRDEILVTASVPVAVTGAPHHFEPFGEHTLKGVPGSWDLQRVTTTPATHPLTE